METTAPNASFHNTVSAGKARIIGIVLKVLSIIPAATLVLALLIGFVNYGFGDNAISKKLWLPIVMLSITALQFLLRYVYDQPFDLKGYNRLSAIIGIIWFISLVECL